MRYILSLYLWLVLFIYSLFFLVFAIIVSYIFPIKKYTPWLQKLLQFIFTIMFIKVEIEGSENITPDKTYLYMANHVSLFDLPLLGGFIPGYARGVEANRQHAWPLYGWAMRRLGNIPIDRKNIFSSLSSISKTASILTEGKSMIILPEGHRTMDGELRQFKSFPFLLAKKTEVEILPIGLSGLYRLKNKNSWIINPNTVKIKFGKPIGVKTIKELPTKELRDKVRDEINNLIEYL
ncbi:MAG: 1-acyl-sn-glycerol-3-phosphate acyltransferase [Melioribacteraceae bacterium]|nr:1-acyl-sn-glycerol-3-phosphate acyltransferase [Melioribacteraceae bacterium]